MEKHGNYQISGGYNREYFKDPFLYSLPDQDAETLGIKPLFGYIRHSSSI